MKANFYIQSKGLNSGKPLKNPIQNCFAVTTNTPLAYQVCYCLFLAKAYYPYIHGTAIPFVRLKDVQRIIEPAFKKEYCTNKLEALEKIDLAIDVEIRKIQMYKQLKTAIASETLKNANK